jgi:glycosyltransferase involved in cell wall biosynthesis
MNKPTFPGRVGIQQRVLPNYRIDFFDLLAESCSGGLSIFAGDVQQLESIPTSGMLKDAQYAPSNNYHFRDINSAYYLLWQSGFVDWLENWNPDVLIVEANPRYLSTYRGIHWMHKRGKPVIGWGLGIPEIGSGKSLGDSISSRMRSFLRFRMLEQTDALISYSHNGAKEYRTVAGSEKPVYVAHNAVAKRPVGPVPTREPQYSGNPIVLYVGRLQPRKKLDNLIHACANLDDDLQPILWIVGDGHERGKLERLSNKIYPKTEFKGTRFGAELADIFQRADIFVLPGTGGLAVQEAMSYALPVIVAEGDGTQGDLVKPENGWLIPQDDEHILFETLQKALSDPGRLRQMGASSFQVVQNEINIEQMVNTFVDVMNKTALNGSS